MTIYENNKQLLNTIGGNADNYSTDFEVRKAILDALGGDSSMCSNIYEVDLQILKIFQESGGAGGEKVKVKTLTVKNDCIVDGYWPAENIDTINVMDMYGVFEKCSSLQSLDVSGWNTSNVMNMTYMFRRCCSLQLLDVSNFDTNNVTDMNSMFRECSSLQSLDVSNFDTNNVTNMGYMFYYCSSLQSLDVSGWNTSKVMNMSSMFNSCKKLTTLIGGRTIDEVLSDNISALNGLKINISLNDTILDRASLRALINGLADLTGSTSQTLTLGVTLKAKLTEEDIAIATSKNWTIS